MIIRAVLALALSSALPALAEDLILANPVDCVLGDECYIQQYMDRDPGKGFSDYHCQALSYDGHKGTDFALPTRAAMISGVNVLAAADGRVLGFRDGMSDDGYNDATAAEIEGKECGNGVLLVHPGGWETQYCHLKNGSINIRNDQTVKAGDILGEIGQSGKAEFPHLHFSVRKGGKKVDPFDPDGALTCDTPGDTTLWAKTPIYQPGGVVDIGITDAIPDYDDVKAGTAGAENLSTSSPALVIFGFTFGTRKDDVVRLSLTGPVGEVVSTESVLERRHAQAFRAIGKHRRRDWAAGDYVGTASLIRDGKVISSKTREFTLAPAK
ncbi:MAG: M23 family metallopeptidase [Sulfitobacter sp.]